MFKKENDCRLSAEEIEARAAALLSEMTLKEKVWMMNGNWDGVDNATKHNNPYNPVPIATNGLERLNISPVKFTDGPRGIVMGKSTCFPVSMARGASFDRDLEKRVGDVIGKEARAQGANLFAGVCINLLRHPAWGRAQETYGEDPYLLGEMGKTLTESVQAHNVMACIKHYAVNNIENSRFTVSVRADEKTMKEVYLPHFKKCVDAGAASVMGAYNRYEGTYCCESATLLTEILRNEWHFEGFTISDFFFGVHDTKKAVEAGLDIEMPMPIHYQKNLLKAVEEGAVAEEVIDRAVIRILKTLLVFENSPDKMDYPIELVACNEHTELARETAEKSMVLIKNENNVLPFDPLAKKILVVGELAAEANTGDHGSSRIYSPYVKTHLEGITSYLGQDVRIIHCSCTDLDKARAEAPEADCVIIAAGYDYKDEGEYITSDPALFAEVMAKGYDNQDMPDKSELMTSLFKDAAVAAEFSSKEGDDGGGDRKSLSLKTGDIDLINQVGRLNPNTVVVLIGGSMIMTREWDKSAPAILYAWYSGMEGGSALPRILFGDVNPGGRLPFTIPREESHLPHFSNTDDEITYDLFHGYSLLDKKGLKPAYPFGFGLSYTTVEYRDMIVEKKQGRVDVGVTLTNTGKRDGWEVVQVYAGVKTPGPDCQKKLLKGFEKVFLKKGEQRVVTVTVNIAELKIFSNEARKWIFTEGPYTFYMGPSSDDDALLTQDIDL